MAKALDDYIYCSPFLSVASLDNLLDRPAEDGQPFQIEDYEPPVEVRIDRQWAYETIHAAVDRLPSRQREVISAIFFAEGTVTETAKQLKISAAAVVKLRGKGLKHLLSSLAPQRHILFA